MSDRIIVTRIAVVARHGVLPEEERLGQNFYVSVECRLDLRRAGETDAMSDSVDYAALVGLARRVATERRFYLIEALAHTIAMEILETFGAVDTAIVKIDKPGAPVSAITDGIAVEVTRHRHG